MTEAEDTKRVMRLETGHMAPFNSFKVDDLEPGVTRYTGLSLIRYFISSADGDFVGAYTDKLLESYPRNSGYNTVVNRYAIEDGMYFAIVTRLKRLADVLPNTLPCTVGSAAAREQGRRIDDAWQKGE